MLFKEQTYSIRHLSYYQTLAKVIGITFIILFGLYWYLVFYFNLYPLFAKQITLHLSANSKIHIIFLQIYLTFLTFSYGLAGVFLIKLNRLAYQFFFFMFFLTLLLLPYWLIISNWSGAVFSLLLLIWHFLTAKAISRLLIRGVLI